MRAAPHLHGVRGKVRVPLKTRIPPRVAASRCQFLRALDCCSYRNARSVVPRHHECPGAAGEEAISR